jgi:hypothetical protein
MGFKPESCQQVFTDKFGDCKGMANLTTEMLKIAGFDARLTWIGTHDQPYSYDIPTLYVDNHMICTVIKDGKYIFLDATEKNSDLGVNADRIQGREVLIQDGDNFIRTQVPVLGPDENITISQFDLEILADNTLKGSATSTYNGTAKSFFKSTVMSKSKKDQEEIIKSILGSGTNTSVKINAQKGLGRDSVISIGYECLLKNQIIVAGDEKYINLDNEKSFSHLDIEEDRKIDLHFTSKYNVMKKVKLRIPVDYKITYVPESLTFSNEFASFNLNVKVENNIIEYTKEIKMNSTKIKSTSFDEWNGFIKKLNNFYDDKVIIIKN